MVASNSARRAIALALAGLTAATTLSACTGSSGGGSASNNAGGVNVPGNNAAGIITQFKPGSRQDAPALSGNTLTGAAYSTSYTGHVTVINIWGAWCVACREEAPSFAEAAKAYAKKDVQFLGIDTMESSTQLAVDYNSEFGISYPSLQDPNESILLQLRDFISTQDIPSTLIVDPSGKIAYRAFGGITEPQLDQGLDYALTGS